MNSKLKIYRFVKKLTSSRKFRLFVGFKILLKIGIIWWMSTSSTKAQAQESMTSFTLDKVIEIAKKSSAQAMIANIEYRRAYWQYKSFKANFLPQVSAEGTVPSFDRNIQSTTQPDGSIKFVPISQVNTIGSLSASQRVGLTGSRLFANSRLQYYKNFETSDILYNSTPITIGLSQPIFQANPYRWNKKIQALRFESAKKNYAESMEQISVQACDRYFDLLIAQVSLSIAEKNVALSDTLFKIAKGRFNLGKIAENELLQMKLSKMNSESNRRRSQIDVQTAGSKLLRYLNLEAETSITLVLPKLIPEINFDLDTAYAFALKNKAQILSYKIRELESERNLAVAKSDNRFNADLTASYGFASSSANFNSLYVNPDNQQGVRVGVEIPLWSGGKSRSNRKLALAQNELNKLNIEQEQLNFEQEIKLFLNQYTLVEDQLKIGFESDTIAEKRYDITVKRYMIGKIGITDLNIALNEKNQAKRSLLQQLRNYWNTYYRLRFYTLYDFEANGDVFYEYPEE